MRVEVMRGDSLSVEKRLVLLGVLALVLLLVSLLIYPLVGERTTNAKRAVESIAAPWGKKQTLGGPMIVVPYVQSGEDGKLERREMAFMPDSLAIAAEVEPSVRARGIYRALLYRAEATVTGHFEGLRQSQFPSNATAIYWDEAQLYYGVSDVVGLKNFIQCEAGGRVIDLEKVTDQTAMRLSFPTALYGAIGDSLVRQGFPFRLRVELHGHEKISFCPMGRISDVALRLRWGTPSFGGRFLPDSREVSDSLTTARWRVLSINHQIPACFPLNEENVYQRDTYYNYDNDDALGGASNEFSVKLLQPVSHYKQVDRAVKYAVLLIVFTFLTIFFCDYFAKKGIPLFAFLLVGVAVLLFYTLLLSLSEIIGFGWAYVVSGLAVIGLTTAYLYGFLRDWTYTTIGGGVMLLLYAMMYLLLTLESLPLLIGSIFLFIVLAIVMRLSLKMRF